jgi:hypothetical protein
MNAQQLLGLIAIRVGCAAAFGVIGGSVLALIRHFNPHGKQEMLHAAHAPVGSAPPVRRVG